MKVIEQRSITRPVVEQGHFNMGEHLFVEIESCSSQTISCRLPNGKHVTFCFIPGEGGEIECVDIHSTVGQPYKYKPTDADEDLHYVHHAIGFSRKGDTFDTRKVDRPTGLLTVLLGKSHHA